MNLILPTDKPQPTETKFHTIVIEEDCVRTATGMHTPRVAQSAVSRFPKLWHGLKFHSHAGARRLVYLICRDIVAPYTAPTQTPWYCGHHQLLHRINPSYTYLPLPSPSAFAKKALAPLFNITILDACNVL